MNPSFANLLRSIWSSLERCLLKYLKAYLYYVGCGSLSCNRKEGPLHHVSCLTQSGLSFFLGESMNQTNMPSSNVTFQHQGSDQLSPTSSSALGVASIYGITISTLSLFLILWRLKLNKYFKAMLTMMTLMNLFCSTLVVISLLQFAKQGYFLIQDCRLITYPILTLISSPSMINIISILRYYMSKKAAEAKMIGDLKMTFMVVLASLINYAFSPTLLWLQEIRGTKSAVTMCMKEDHHPVAHDLPIIVVLEIVIVTFIGVYSDFKLYHYVRNLNQTFENNVIPWKSVHQQQTENDLYLPLRATIVSVVIFIGLSLALCAGLLCFIILSSDSSLKPGLILVFVMILSNSLPMVIILITVAHQAKKSRAIAQAQPPAQLHFHDRAQESRDEIEMIDKDDMEPTFIVDLPGSTVHHL